MGGMTGERKLTTEIVHSTNYGSNLYINNKMLSFDEARPNLEIS
jgi:hypothetical protein